MARPREFKQSDALERAIDAFWQHGYGAIPVRDLCDAMNIHSGSLYGTFGDKRSLFLASLDRYIDTVSRQAVERIDGAPSGSEGIRAFFNFLVDAILTGKRRWGCLVTNSVAEAGCRDPDVAARAKLQFARLENAFTRALARAQSDGELGEGNGPDSALFLVCLVQGMNVLAKTGPDRKTLQGIVDTALNGLLKPGCARPAASACASVT